MNPTPPDDYPFDRLPDDQLSLCFGRELRDEGIDLVHVHTPALWISSFEQVVLAFPVGKLITSEDVRAIVGDPPNHLNAIGAQMHKCVLKGWLKKIGYQQARRSPAHARIIGVYQRV